MPVPLAQLCDVGGTGTEPSRLADTRAEQWMLKSFRQRANKVLCQVENPFLQRTEKRISSKSRVNFFFSLTNVKNPAIIVLNGIDGNQYAVRSEPQRALGRWKRVPRRSRIHPGAADANAVSPVSRVCRVRPLPRSGVSAPR